MNCFRYFNFTSFEQVDRLTVAQYNVMMEALELKMFDRNFEAHRQAYLDFAVRAERKTGKKTVPVYKKFQKFFDYERELENLKKKRTKKTDPRFAGLSKLIKKRDGENGRIL